MRIALFLTVSRSIGMGDGLPYLCIRLPASRQAPCEQTDACEKHNLPHTPYAAINIEVLINNQYVEVSFTENVNVMILFTLGFANNR